MKIAYVGTLVSPDSIINYSGGSIAGNKYQYGITCMFSENKECDYYIMLPFSAFPKTKKILVGRQSKEAIEKCIHVVPYINIPVIKQVTFLLSLLCMLFLWAIKNRNEQQKIFVVFNMFVFMCLPIFAISKLFRIKRAAIIADLTGKNVKGMLQKWQGKFEIYAIRKFDGIIPITKNIQQDYADNIPYIVIEGGCFKNNYIPQLPIKQQVLYTGALDDNSNIEVLLQAFSNCNMEDWQLLIAGKGKYEYLVKRYEKKYKSIHYLGYIENNEALYLQYQSAILVCPRLPNGYVTKYTFPSKIIEYLLTGNKVVCFELEGIPESYKEFLNIPSHNDESSLSECLRNLMKMKQEKNYRQIAFIETRNWTDISKKVLVFLKGIVNG